MKNSTYEIRRCTKLYNLLRHLLQPSILLRGLVRGEDKVNFLQGSDILGHHGVTEFFVPLLRAGFVKIHVGSLIGSLAYDSKVLQEAPQ